MHVFERGDTLSFLSCGIALWVGDHVSDPRKMFYSSPAELEKLGATMHMRTDVTDIDVAGKTLEFRSLETGDSQTLQFDKLVVTTGSRPVVPSIPGIESDRAMRNRGYMRGSYGFTGHAGEGYDPLTTGNTRGSQQSIRRILGRIQMKQSENYYLRLKNVVADAIDLKWGIDFLELVPSSVIDNDQYAEDWY